MKDRTFKISYPYIGFKNIDYTWPDPDKHHDLFAEKGESIINELFERTKQYADELRINLSDYPHIELGMNGIHVHIGSGGQWINIINIAGTYCSSLHNISGYPCMLAFNLASATIELIDEDFEAPFIVRDDEKYSIRYPLPEGHVGLPAEKCSHIFKPKTLQRWFEASDFGKVIEVKCNGIQRVVGNKGVLQVKNDMFVGEELDGHDVHKASYVMSNMMNSFIPEIAG